MIEKTQIKNSGFLLINKPRNWTSHDAVSYIRNIARKKTGNKKIKVGHAGTLDPFATGLLIIGIGHEATKLIDEFKGMPKEYIAKLKLGAISDTYDSEGKIQASKHLNTRTISKDKVEKIIQNFIGKQNQLPPMHSAKKIGGKKLYELARKGIEVDRKPHNIEIYDIKLMEYNWPNLKIKVNCSTGTYIRTLAHDIGEKLKVGAYCEELMRTKIGKYFVEKTITPKEITVENLESKLFDFQSQ